MKGKTAPGNSKSSNCPNQLATYQNNSLNKKREVGPNRLTTLDNILSVVGSLINIYCYIGLGRFSPQNLCFLFQ